MSAIYRHNQSNIKPSVSDKCIFLGMVSERGMLYRLQRQWQWQWLSSSPPEDESPVPLHTGASSAADAPQDGTGNPCAAVLLCMKQRLDVDYVTISEQSLIWNCNLSLTIFIVGLFYFIYLLFSTLCTSNTAQQFNWPCICIYFYSICFTLTNL